MPRKTIRLFITTALLISACRAGLVGRPPGQFPGRTATPAPALTRATTTPASTATPRPPRTPAPTFDFSSFLLTQAYANHTPRATITPPGTAVAGAQGAGGGEAASIFPSLTPTAHYMPPAAVIMPGPVLIPNAGNAATCKIRSVGDCTPAMERGVTLFFIWTFGVRGSEPFNWGNAAVVVERDGQPFKWSQAKNDLQPPPKAGEPSRLLTGQQAEFRGALDNAQPGAYQARLIMCLNSVPECDAGNGWQDVGGDAINFVITR